MFYLKWPHEQGCPVYKGEDWDTTGLRNALKEWQCQFHWLTKEMRFLDKLKIWYKHEHHINSIEAEELSRGLSAPVSYHKEPLLFHQVSRCRGWGMTGLPQGHSQFLKFRVVFSQGVLKINGNTASRTPGPLKSLSSFVPFYLAHRWGHTLTRISLSKQQLRIFGNTLCPSKQLAALPSGNLHVMPAIPGTWGASRSYSMWEIILSHPGPTDCPQVFLYVTCESLVFYILFLCSTPCCPIAVNMWLFQFKLIKIILKI